MFLIVATKDEKQILVVGSFEERSSSEKALIHLCNTSLVTVADSIDIVEADEEDDTE